MGLFDRLKSGLGKTRGGFSGKIGSLLLGRRVDEDLFDELEEALIEADLGISTSMALMDRLRDRAAAEKIRAGQHDTVWELLKEEERPLKPYYTPRDRQGNPINILKVKPKTDLSKCIGCGHCVTLCPMGSIDPRDVTQYLGVCIKCGACEKGCPEGARYYDDPGYLYHKSELELQYARRAQNTVFL